MSDYFAGAGFGGENKERPLYRNPARRALVGWAWFGLVGGSLIELTIWGLLSNSALAFDGATLLWLVLGFVLIGAGVTSAVGHAVVKAIAYDDAYRNGPLPAAPFEPPAVPRTETPHVAAAPTD